jgi:hypothetical protein
MLQRQEAIERALHEVLDPKLAHQILQLITSAKEIDDSKALQAKVARTQATPEQIYQLTFLLCQEFRDNINNWLLAPKLIVWTFVFGSILSLKIQKKPTTDNQVMVEIEQLFEVLKTFMGVSESIPIIVNKEITPILKPQLKPFN